jgi:putative membrane protein
MQSTLLLIYPFLKIGHVIFMVFWMAGLFMLPRYFAYHCETAPGGAESETWKAREARILKVILRPAMTATWLFGLVMIALRPEYLALGWLHAKLALVVGLTGFHLFLSMQVRRFAADSGLRNGRTWRMLNEIPSFAAIAIVILVIVKPF